MTGRRLGLVAVVAVMVVSFSACNSAKLGQQTQSSSTRYYNNAQYGTLAVFDYGGIQNPNPLASPTVLKPGTAGMTIAQLQAQRAAAGLPPWQCVAGMTAAGIGIVGVIGLPEDAPVYVAAVWAGLALDLATTTDACMATWQQSIAFDAFSRWMFACSDPGGFSLSGFAANLFSLGSCNTMGWVTRGIESHPEIFSFNQVKSITMCSALIVIPFAGYDCLDSG